MTEVRTICPDFRFRGRGQRDTPVTGVRGIPLFILRDVKANLSCALSSYQIEPTARDSPQNYIGIDALQTLSVVHFARRLS